MSATSVTDLKHSLRSLIASSSMEAVYTSLTQVMKEDYEFLQKFYSSSAAPSSLEASPSSLEASPAAAAAPAVAATAVVKKKVAKKSAAVAAAAAPSAQLDQEEEAPRIRADTKVRVVKKPTDPQDLPTVATQPAQQEAQPFVHADSGLRNPQEQKKWQKEQEDKKMRDLRATGVNPASLLTEANLRKWVEEEKKTFAFIAREYVGLSDGVVAAEAKKYGLQSDTSKRRAMIAASKART